MALFELMFSYAATLADVRTLTIRAAACALGLTTDEFGGNSPTKVGSSAAKLFRRSAFYPRNRSSIIYIFALPRSRPSGPSKIRE